GAADLKYSTYLGGAAGINESGYGIAVDGDGKVYITGKTCAGDFPTTPGAFDTTFDGFFSDVFISKINPGGHSAADLLYSTYLGGWYLDNGGHDITVDTAGDIYVIGDTYSSDFPTTPGAFQTALNDYTDLFVVRLHPEGAGPADLVYSTYLGGDYLDYGRGIAVGQEETVYIAGYSASSDFPTTAGSYDVTYGGGTCGSFPCYDAIGSKLNVKPNYIISGTVVDVDSQPILGVLVSAGETYQGVTNTCGEYTITGLEPGEFTLTPKKNGYFFSPETRTVTIPPSATGQNFTGVHINKKSSVPQSRALNYGDAVTYTVSLVFPEACDVMIYDRVPTYTTYISGSLNGHANVVYDSNSDAISGTLSLAATQHVTLTFAMQVEITGASDFSPLIINQACVHPSGGGAQECDTVWNRTYTPHVFLPIVLR
ncbi:MAG: SBBP repeat-containing protein, partial [Anaerolineales bacterium]|nr:SBBP repeat-containing protein [Anaerolineales bacterium]